MTVLVTGAARGLGAAIARRFHADGATVVLLDKRTELGERTASDLGAEFRSLDVTSADGWAEMVAGVLTDHGHIDVLVNNAGVGAVGPMVDMPFALYEKLVAVNQTGVWLGMQAVLPVMTEAGRGSIVNIASIDGLRGTANLAAYAATKHAVVGMSRSVALEVAASGVRVNSVCPGAIGTPGLADTGDRQSGDGGFGDWASRVPMRRLAQPDEVAAAVAYLAGDDASYVTGTELVVDGAFITGLGK